MKTYEIALEENNKLSEKGTYNHNLISIYKKIRINKFKYIQIQMKSNSNSNNLFMPFKMKLIDVQIQITPSWNPNVFKIGFKIANVWETRYVSETISSDLGGVESSLSAGLKRLDEFFRSSWVRDSDEAK